MDDADLVVQSLHEAKRDLVLWFAIGSDSIPMTIDHLSEFLVRFEPLPFERSAPVLEEAPRPALALVAPQLTEGLPEQVGGVEPLVGRQQRLERLAAFQGEILPARKQGVLLPLDVAGAVCR